MSNSSNSLLLLSTIKELPFTDQFKAISNKLRFNTLGDIVEVEVAALIKMPGFNYHILLELTQFLEERNLAHLLKQG